MPVFVGAETTSLGPSRTCILGQPGAGKTGLAATWPHPYFIDLDGGAGSTNCPRISFLPTDDPYLGTLAEIEALGRSEYREGALWLQKNVGGKQISFPVQTLVIDTFDVIQENQKTKILGRKPKMGRDDWDTLFNQVYPVALAWAKLPIHVVVNAHIRDLDQEDNKPGVRGFSVQGALRDKLPRWFDYILHVVSAEDGQRHIVTQPMINRGYSYVAKDRHRTFADMGKNGVFPIKLAADGLPERVVADRIAERHPLAPSVK